MGSIFDCQIWFLSYQGQARFAAFGHVDFFLMAKAMFGTVDLQFWEIAGARNTGYFHTKCIAEMRTDFHTPIMVGFFSNCPPLWPTGGMTFRGRSNILSFEK